MSDRGDLALCMVDGDARANAGARRSRGKALAASIVLEAVMVGGLVVWPLLTVAVLPSHAVVTPLPPYRGFREPAQSPPELPRSSRAFVRRDLVFTPVIVPQNIDTSVAPAPPGLDESASIGVGTDFLPGGSDTGRPVEIERPVQPQPKPPASVTRSAGVMAAMLVHRVEPTYPHLAQTIGLSGTVVLRARIGTDGEVHELELVSGNALLAQAALEAVRQWRYRPTYLNGQPVEVDTQITVNFVLNR
jgi:periplasmic protein TonB